MSVKFERETFKQAEGVAGPAVSAAAELLGKDGPLPGTTGKHPISEAVGTALTGGKQMAGTKGYLMVCHNQGLASSMRPAIERRLLRNKS
jgi:hypothetical protein